MYYTVDAIYLTLEELAVLVSRAVADNSCIHFKISEDVRAGLAAEGLAELQIKTGSSPGQLSLQSPEKQGSPSRLSVAGRS